jgi:hypothetical protein
MPNTMSSANLLTLDVSDRKYAIRSESGKAGLIPGSDEARDIWNRFIQEYEVFCRFWQPRYEIARKCNRYRRRDIFSQEEREEYEYVYNKIPIEPQEMKQVINVLVGQIAQTVKGGAIEMEDTASAPNVASPAVYNVVIKWLENMLKLDRKKKGALREALYGGIPNWLWYDRERTADGALGRLRATLLPWDSTLCSFLFLEEDGSDIDHLKRVMHKTKFDMFDAYPDRKEVFETHMDALNTQPDYYNNILGFDSSINSENRKDLFYPRITTGRYDAIQGYLFAIESTYVIHKKREVQINDKTRDVVILPAEWGEMETERWHAQFPEYNLTKTQDCKVLWVTTIDNTGMVWENSEHWFQCEGMLPAVCYIPALEDKIPTGVGEDMLPYVLGIACAETEGLAQVRTGNGDITHIVEGASTHPSRIHSELSSEHGVLLYKEKTVREHGGLNNVVKHETRRSNPVFNEYADRLRAQKREINNITPSIMGSHSDPRQSQRSKITEITQTMIMHGQMIDNYTDFNLRNTQLLCNMIPYFLNEYQVIEIVDEFGKKVGPLEVNVPKFEEGPDAAMTLINDLTSGRYRVVPIATDDSQTNREREMKEFQEMIVAIGNQLLQSHPDIIAALWKDWPNKYCREAAQGLQAVAEKQRAAADQAKATEAQADAQKEQTKAQVAMEDIKRPNWNIRLSPTDYEQAPEGFRLMMQTLAQINNSPVQIGQQAPQEQQAEAA